MSISARGFQYLNFLSDFWRVFYSDASVLETILRTEAEIVKSMYFTILQEQVPRAVQDARVFKEEFWNLIELVYEDTSFEVVTRKGQTFYSYPLDESYAHLPQLYNIIFNPTVRLKEGKDFFIERSLEEPRGESVVPTVASRILFKDDPFLNNDIPKRITSDNKLSMVLFAPKAFIDDMQLFSRHGDLLNLVDLSSEAYKAFLHGVMYLFTNGPSISALNAGISLAAGYPVARQTEVINSVLIEEGVYYLSSDQGNVYEFPRKVISTFNELTQSVESVAYPTLKMSGAPYQDEVGNVLSTVNFSDASLVDGVYPTFFEVDSFDPFISDLRIVDSETEPFWWRKQVDKLASTLVPDLPDELRSHPGVKDYLFETYFRFNTFGVFVDYRAFREDFQKLPDFMDIIMRVKPSYKSFVVYEDELHVFSLVRLRPNDAASLQGSVLISPTPSPVVNPDGTTSEPPRSTDIPTPVTDPVTGLPTNGIDPATGQPYPPNILDNINNVFDAIALRNFLGIYDVKSITPFVGMTLPLDNAPIRIGIGLENLRHSIDTVFWAVVLSPESLVRLTPAIEPIIGMGMLLGMGAKEGIIERHRFTIGFTPDDEELSLGADEDPNFNVIEEPLPSIPVGGGSSGITPSGITVSWLAASGATSYEIYLEDLTSSTVITNFVDIGNVLSYEFTGLTALHDYTWSVQGVNVWGTGDPLVDTFTTPAPIPSAPTILSFSDLTSSSVTINWSLESGATYYKIWVRDITNNTILELDTNVGNVTTYDLVGLSESANHEYKVLAGNASGESAYSALSTFTTDAAFGAPVATAATNIGIVGLLANTFRGNWGSVVGASSYVYDVAYDNTFLQATSDYSNLSVGNVLFKDTILDLETDASDLIAWNLQDNSSTIVGGLTGTLTAGSWGLPRLSSETYSLRLGGSADVSTTADNTALTDFSIRLLLRFDSGDKAAITEHVLFSKYNTTGGISGSVLFLTYDAVVNQIFFNVTDSTSTFGSPKDRAFVVPYNLEEGVDYLIQASFLLQDPANSNLNKFTVTINGVDQSGAFIETIANIDNLFQTNLPFYLGRYVGNSGTSYYGQFSSSRCYFSTRYRSVSEALRDAQNIGLVPQTLYYRVKASNGISLSTASNTITTTKQTSLERLLFLKTVSSVLQVFSSNLAGGDVQQHTNTTDVINDAVYLPNGDIIISKNTGIEYKLFRLNKNESYSMEHELLDNSDNPLSLNNNSVASSHNGLYLVYSKESPPVSSNLYEYNLITRVETQLTAGDPPFTYAPAYDRADENIYHSSGTFGTDMYINKYNRALSSNDILSTDSKSIFSAVDNDNNYLYYAQFTSYPALIIKKFDLALNTSSDVVITGNSYFNNLFLDSSNNYLYFANDRSGLHKLYRSTLDGVTQELLLGALDGEDYQICDLKVVP